MANELIKFCLENLSYVFDNIEIGSNTFTYYNDINTLNISFRSDSSLSQLPFWSEVKYDVLTFCELYLLKNGKSISISTLYDDDNIDVIRTLDGYMCLPRKISNNYDITLGIDVNIPDYEKLLT